MLKPINEKLLSELIANDSPYGVYDRSMNIAKILAKKVDVKLIINKTGVRYTVIAGSRTLHFEYYNWLIAWFQKEIDWYNK